MRETPEVHPNAGSRHCQLRVQGAHSGTNFKVAGEPPWPLWQWQNSTSFLTSRWSPA